MKSNSASIKKCFYIGNKVLGVEALKRIKWMNPKAQPKEQYQPSYIEHIANIITHAIWIFPSILGALELYNRSQSYVQIVSAFVYGLTLIFLFSVSTSFHCVFYCSNHCCLKDILHRCDRAMIYIFIAGSYFPWLTIEQLPQHGWASHMRWIIWIMAVLGCEARKVWMIVRHGTRNPSNSDIESINNRLPEIKERILNSPHLPNEYIKNRDLDLFRKWKFTLDEGDEKKLTHEGEEEMLLMAERMQSRFPSVFDNVYSNSTYRFKYTYSQRTKKSAYYFAAGLFGKQTAKDVWFPEPSKMDPILRFYKLCKKWNRDVKGSVKSNGEHRKFGSSPAMLQVVKEINERLGLNNELDVSDVQTMYIACGFETAWNKKSKSPWCSPFTEENLKVFEYRDDLKYYWQDGYGHELTYKQACPAFGDMISNFDTTNSRPKATIYFTHSGTLLKMLAHMGLYKDDYPLTAENFNKMKNRRWRTSLIDSFGTNLAFVLFNCGNTKKILVLHQENIVRLPSCPDSDLCDYRTVNDYYNQSIESCDFNAMCDNSS